MADFTVADIAHFEDQNIAGILEDFSLVAPALSVLPAISCPGTTFAQPRVTALGSNSAFRSANVGKATSAPSITSDTVTLKYLDGSYQLDIQVAESAHAGPQAAVAMAQKYGLIDVIQKLEKVVLFGDDAFYGDIAGFEGIWGNIDSSMDIDAGGEAEGEQTTAIVIAKNEINVILGHDAQLSQSEIVKQMAYDASGNPFYAYVQAIGSWAAVSGIYGAKTACRIYNCDGTKPLTDDLMAEAILAFPAYSRKDLVVVTSRAGVQQLRQSRTATNATGAPAPMPAESFGVPVIMTDAISGEMEVFDPDAT